MGSETGQDNERPVHRVWVDGFCLASCQVTNSEYLRFLDATGGNPPPFWWDSNFNAPQQPVVAVSWFEAVGYCECMRAITGRKYRLSTEAEWEHAPRSGACGKLSAWCNDPLHSRPDYEYPCKNGLEPVRRSADNAFALD